MPPHFRKATAAQSHQGLLGPRPRVQTLLAPPQGAVATLKGLGPGVLGSLGRRHGLGQAKTSIVELTRLSRGRAPTRNRDKPNPRAQLPLYPKGPLPH